MGFEVTDVVKDYFHHLWYNVPVPLILVSKYIFLFIVTCILKNANHFN